LAKEIGQPQRLGTCCVRREVFDQASQAAVTAYPKECIGVLLSDDDGTIVQQKEFQNLACDLAHGSKVKIKTVKFAVRNNGGLAFAGLYHSHPNGSAVLSRQDQNLLNQLPWCWVFAVRQGRTIDAAAYRFAKPYGPRFFEFEFR